MNAKGGRYLSGFEPPVAEQAAEWLITIKDPELSRSEKEAFLSWLQRSPVHVEEFLRVSSLDAELSGRQLGFDANALATECGALDTIATLGTNSSRLTDVASGRRRPRMIAVAASVAAGLVLGIGLMWATLHSPSRYTTERGEQRSVALPDGSLMELNTKTQARVAYGERTRTITLLEGEALFTVAKDPSRPFVVKAGAQSIQATGTRFNVSEHSARTVVTVIEGKVIVRPLASSSTVNGSAFDRVMQGRVELSPGQQLVAVRSAAPQLLTVEPDRVTAWQNWKLYFDEEPLAAVIAQFNRYNQQQLQIDDPQLMKRRVSGVFFANRPDSLIAFIASRDSLQVTEEREGLRVIRRR